MEIYKVTFNVNGTAKSINCESVKIGNRYLQCFGNVNGDSEKVAFLPFDSVLYVTHTDVTVASSSVTEETTDGLTVAE